MRLKFKITPSGLVNVLLKPNGKNTIAVINERGQEIKMQLKAVEREDGSGNNFNITVKDGVFQYTFFVRCKRDPKSNYTLEELNKIQAEIHANRIFRTQQRAARKAA